MVRLFALIIPLPAYNEQKSMEMRMEIYVVRPGDTVDTIARDTGADLSSMIYANQLVYPYRLAVGQALLLPSGTGNWENASGRGSGPDDFYKMRSALAGGYAYPFISRWVLTETLPYMTELYVFSYGFTVSGELIPPALDDGWLVQAALARGVRPILTLTPLGADGRFNNNLVSVLVNDRDVQLALLRRLVGVLAEKGYAGVNIDFEYVLASDRDAFTAFVARTTVLLNEFEYEVSVALVPKTSAGQPGLLYEGMDYAGLGAAADWVLLMTYEWGYTYGPPMAVAPINQVRRVLEYALSCIPAERISLGVPNYGYDWALPFVSGTTKAATLGNVEAVQEAILHGVEIQYDELAQSPYFYYWQYGVQHEVWFEDVRSFADKFRLVRERGLRGIGVWQIMQLYRAGWELFKGKFR